MALQVTVTGGSGFIAGHLIHQLLEKGYTVHTTVRSAAPNNPKTQHLQRMAGTFSGKLRLFEADLLVPGSFEQAVQGSAYVFHTASPVAFTVEDPQRDLVDPAVNGTKNLLSAVAKNKSTVRRVILTSSVAAVRSRARYVDGRETPKNGQLYTEEDFNESSTIDNEAYFVSKARAERAAWNWAKEEDVALVTINPSIVLGPMMWASDAVTPKMVKGMIEGAPLTLFSSCVDVRDVARAHVLAAEIPTASGRYIVGAAAPFNARWVSQVLRARFPEYEIPLGAATHEISFLDASKVQRELGLTFRPMSETVIDAAVSLINLGLAHPTLKAVPAAASSL